MPDFPGFSDENEPLRFERKGMLGVATLNRPDANNAVDDAMRGELLRLCDHITAERNITALLITGAGNEAFSTGYDLPQLAALTPAEAETLARGARLVSERIAALEIPVIAAIKGACLGAGLEIALQADIRIGRADSRYGFPGVNLGLAPGAAAVDRLTRLIGFGPATALFMTGGMVTAERAFMMGLITNIVGVAEYEGAVMEFCEHMAGLPAVALRETKRLLRAAAMGGVPESVGADALRRCFAEGEVGERLRQMFGGRDPGTAIH